VFCVRFVSGGRSSLGGGGWWWLSTETVTVVDSIAAWLVVELVLVVLVLVLVALEYFGTFKILCGLCGLDCKDDDDVAVGATFPIAGKDEEMTTFAAAGFFLSLLLFVLDVDVDVEFEFELRPIHESIRFRTSPTSGSSLLLLVGAPVFLRAVVLVVTVLA
jgi:hypothetical protein